MSLDQVIGVRRSVRKYRQSPVDDDTLTAVLRAGCMGPSSKNEQDFAIVAVRDADTRARIAQACSSQSWVGEAPVVLVAYSTNQRVMNCGQSAGTVDAAIAMAYMQLKAAELGLGTCWLGAFDAWRVSDELGLPQAAAVVAVSPLGWPEETPQPPARKAPESLYEVR